jgi:NADH-quinone oxidoreductase subunit J
MVFMVYAIMLLDVRDASFSERFSKLLWPGLAAIAVLLGVLLDASRFGRVDPGQVTGNPFGVQPFSAAFLGEYWLYFELSSVLLVVAVLAAVAIVKLRGRRDG